MHQHRRAGQRPLSALLLALFVGACTAEPVIRPPESALERGVFLAEAAEDGRHGISNPDPAAHDVARVVEPAYVDQDSRVEVRVDTSAIAAEIRHEGTALQELQNLTARSLALTERIAALGELARAQGAVARAYEALLRAEPAAREGSLAALAEARAQYEALAAGPGALAGMIQADLVQFERDLQAEASRSGFTMRMEAFLYAPGRDPVALHLKGYDLLRQGQMERRDRYGLFLTGDALQSFQDLAQQTEESAAVAKVYQKEREELAVALRALSSLVVGEYAQLGADSIVLARELSAEALAARAEASQGALRSFLAQLSGEAQARLQPAVNSLGSRLAETSSRSAMSGLGPRLSSAAGAFTRARDAAAGGHLSGLGGGVAEALADAQLAAGVLALDELTAGVEEALDGLTGELRDSIRASWGSSAALVEMRGWEDLHARTHLLAARAANLTLSVSLRDLPPELRTPEILEVPGDRVPATEFDLSLSSRQMRDRIVLRSTLMQDGKPVGDPMEAHFRVTRFGWHTDIHPSVVLARSLDRVPGAADFRFVSAVSWLHSYLPRPEEEGFLAGTMRVFQPAAGLHAAILNFDSEEEIEIGMGVNVGLWNGVLQAGFGYNLMGDSGAGREYVFIGSSLIPLVQAVQQGITSLAR